jgi:multidrug resistance efflux pump
LKLSKQQLATGGVVLIAFLAVALKYWDYVANPWTRNGQVNADVIQITPRVSGPIVELAVDDNQFVRAGDLLFVIDPRTFEAARDQARARYDKSGDDYIARERAVDAARAQVSMREADVDQAESQAKAIEAEIEKDAAEYERQQEMLPQKATSRKAVERAKAGYQISLERRAVAQAGLLESRAGLAQAKADLAQAQANVGAAGDANASIREARAALRTAELNLEFTEVRAPVDGYVTNLNLQLGSYAVANQPALALVDVDSFYVYGFFRETEAGRIRPGDEALVTLMSYPDDPIPGRVASLGWGIAQQDGSTGADLLPNVSPTFEWIRLAQRVPVLVTLAELPDGVELRVGTTASVLVRTGSAPTGKPSAAAGAR